MNTTTSKPGFATMARVLRADLAELEAKADRSGRLCDMQRVAAVRLELSRVERGEL
ncbi:MAG TPA: hypothetical protein VMT47_11770 [Polyangia bacterium]|nr:hypothetical protein [Polyangia bacterium]